MSIIRAEMRLLMCVVTYFPAAANAEPRFTCPDPQNRRWDKSVERGDAGAWTILST
jgi:hypothetical protein